MGPSPRQAGQLVSKPLTYSIESNAAQYCATFDFVTARTGLDPSIYLLPVRDECLLEYADIFPIAMLEFRPIFVSFLFVLCAKTAQIMVYSFLVLQPVSGLPDEFAFAVYIAFIRPVLRQAGGD